MFTFDLPATDAPTAPQVVMSDVGLSAGSPLQIERYPTQNARVFWLELNSTIFLAAAETTVPCLTQAQDCGRTEPVEDQMDGVMIQEVACSQPLLSHPSQTLFSANRNFSAGWSHINDPAKAADFSALSQPFHAYAISGANLRTDGSCNGERTYQAVLVKKLHTWENTHANGLETAIDGEMVGNIDSLVMELKLHSAQSVVPSPQDIRRVYPRLTRRQMKTLDTGMANIDLVFSAGAQRSNKVLAIDLKKYADRWIRITIPMEQMNYYREVNYQRTYSVYEAAKKQRYTSLVINAESQNRKTVQHLMEGKAGVTQLFKELGISIRRIEYVLK